MKKELSGLAALVGITSMVPAHVTAIQELPANSIAITNELGEVIQVIPLIKLRGTNELKTLSTFALENIIIHGNSSVSDSCSDSKSIVNRQ